MLGTGFVWPAFVAGLGSVMPPAELPVVLTVIMASEASVGTQIGAFVAFTFVVLAVIEIPLVGYLVKPEQTQAIMQQLHNWVWAHRQQLFQASLAILGIMLLFEGVGNL